MTGAHCKGASMHLELVKTKFGRLASGGYRLGSSLLDDRIVEVRRLLRTDMSLAEIADEFGVDRLTLRSFIKRRALCDISARSRFITLQRSLKKLDEPAQ